MFKYYVPDFDLWTLNYIVFENTFAGGFITSPIRSLVFRPNIQEKRREHALIIFESVAFAGSVLMVAICALAIYLKVSDNKAKKNLTLMRILKFPYVLLYINFIASLVSIIAMGSLKKDTAVLIAEEKSSENFVGMSGWYQTLTYAQYLSFACLFIFILRWMRLFYCFRDVLYIIRKVIFNLPLVCLSYHSFLYIWFPSLLLPCSLPSCCLRAL